MTVSEKIKTIDDKIEQNKAQYDLDRQAAKISALSGNVCLFLAIYYNDYNNITDKKRRDR